MGKMATSDIPIQFHLTLPSWPTATPIPLMLAPDRSSKNAKNASRAGTRPRILQSSLLCDPVSSMESRLGWHRAVASAEHFDTTVICSESNKAPIATYETQHGRIPGLAFRFVPFQPPMLNDGFLFSYRSFYHAYHQWQKQVLRAALEMHGKRPFDLAHQVGICGYREPGYLWDLEIPFVWGPIGGTQNLPLRFMAEIGISQGVLEASRMLLNEWHLRFRNRVRKAVGRAAKIYAANSQNQADFLRVHGRELTLQLETGIDRLPEVCVRTRHPVEPLRILWSGRFKPWKGLPLLLRALQGLDTEIPFELRIIGYQSCEVPFRRLCNKLGLDAHVTWLGWPDYSDTLHEYEWADVYVFTSLRDTSGTGLLEALAYGCPIVGLDHQGAADIMTDECAVRIQVTSPGEVIPSIRKALINLATNQDLLQSKSKAALRRAHDFTWDVLGRRMIDDYQQVIQKYKERP